MTPSPSESVPIAHDPVDAIARVTAVPSILRLITELTGLRLSFVAQVTDERWLCCAVNDQMGFGLVPRGELDVETTLCKQVRDTQRPIMFGNASNDPHYCNHPTPKLYKFESYVSMPIYMRGHRYFGNLCALDSQPRELSKDTLSMFELFAELIGVQLEAEANYERASTALNDAQHDARLREKFIGVLGHDLRAPLSAISAGIELLATKYANPGAEKVIERMRRSAARMAEMIGDLLDFTRGRLGGGVTLRLAEVADLDELVRGVVEEATASSRRAIEVEGDPPRPLECDRGRVAQARANLVTNALQHGAPGEPVRVTHRESDDAVQIAVSNAGPAIPAERVATMFEPFRRGSAASPGDGLGLGLYIVREIVRAHGGDVVCRSDAGRTTFTMTLPRRATG